MSHRLLAWTSSAALLVALMLAFPHRADAQAGAAEAEARTLVRPVHPIAGYPRYPRYPYAGACLPYDACWPWQPYDRREPRRPVAPEPAPPVDPDIWGTSGSPWGYVRRLPPPTPEGNIQPGFREASTIRPEFAAPASPASAPAGRPVEAPGASR